MHARKLGALVPAFFILIISLAGCTFGQATPTVLPPPQPQPAPPTELPPTIVPAVVHQAAPAAESVIGSPFYDVESSGTAPEKRAPYGDSWDINRLERPFLQDMTYVGDLDISTYMIGKDANWVYVTIVLMGGDPNDKLGIDYAVELDTNQDGFGDFILWAKPPYTSAWDTAPVKVYQDANHDTAGLNPMKSDAGFGGNGYEKLVFNGGVGDADPDLAWVRGTPGKPGVVEFAFKRSWSGDRFLFSVMADAGLRDPGKLDYIDRMTIVEAGSPVRDNKNYPLKGLYAVDNVCRAAFGFQPSGSEPQGCPVQAGPQKRGGGAVPGQPSCTGTCIYGQMPYPDCRCIPG